jgi:hypothetical protein
MQSASLRSTSPRVFRLRACGDQPVAAVALHCGHKVRPEVAPLLAVDEAQRLREEDPYTDAWTEIGSVQAVACRSRFEFDLNRPRDHAVYLRPQDAWGIRVWRVPPPAEVVRRSLDDYDSFYRAMEQVFDELVRRHGCFVVFDLHSYNHRRAGPHAAAAPPVENPEINVGTRSMPYHRWRGIVERLISGLRTFDFPGGPLDVRENVNFGGGYFPQWVHRRYRNSGCALAVEVKKFFMDEWTGALDVARLRAIGRALASTVPEVLAELTTPCLQTIKPVSTSSRS